MDLFDMAMHIKEEGLYCIDDIVFEDNENTLDENITLNLIAPKNHNWIKFNNDIERKTKLKEYKYLSVRNNFHYKNSEGKKVCCDIVGYIAIPKNPSCDHLVISIKDNLHVISSEYFSDMQKGEVS